MNTLPAPATEPFSALIFALVLAALAVPRANAGDSAAFYPAERMEFFADGEGPLPEGKEPDLHGGLESLYLGFRDVTKNPNDPSRRMAGAAAFSVSQETGEVRTVKPPFGQWDVANTFYAPTAGVVILTATDGPRREAVMFESDGFAPLGQAPLSFSREPETKVWIEGMRLIFPSGVPENLAKAFPPEKALGAGVRFWKEIAHRDHAEMIASWVANLTAALPNEEDAKNNEAVSAEGLRLSREALTTAPLPLPPAGELAGKWRVRAVDGSDLGVFLYPFFEARIKNGAHPGELVFEKTTGSQRRAGVLFPAETPGTLVFLGGKATDYEGSLVYSRLADPKSDTPASSDSAGVFFLTAKNRALMVLDVSPAGAWEIYELRR